MAKECTRLMGVLKGVSPCVKEGGCLKRIKAKKCTKNDMISCYKSLSRLSGGDLTK